MAKPRKFTSLRAAHDWLEARGFAQAGMHVWQRGEQTAWVSIELGGYRPRFLIEVR